MKSIKSIFMVFAGLLILSSCNQKENNSAPPAEAVKPQATPAQKENTDGDETLKEEGLTAKQALEKILFSEPETSEKVFETTASYLTTSNRKFLMDEINTLPISGRQAISGRLVEMHDACKTPTCREGIKNFFVWHTKKTVERYFPFGLATGNTMYPLSTAIRANSKNLDNSLEPLNAVFTEISKVLSRYKFDTEPYAFTAVYRVDTALKILTPKIKELDPVGVSTATAQLSEAVEKAVCKDPDVCGNKHFTSILQTLKSAGNASNQWILDLQELAEFANKPWGFVTRPYEVATKYNDFFQKFRNNRETFEALLVSVETLTESYTATEDEGLMERHVHLATTLSRGSQHLKLQERTKEAFANIEDIFDLTKPQGPR